MMTFNIGGLNMAFRDFTMVFQSQELIIMGVPKKTADMEYRTRGDFSFLYKPNFLKEEGEFTRNALPAWSGKALTRIISDHILLESSPVSDLNDATWKYGIRLENCSVDAKVEFIRRIYEAKNNKEDKQ
jgi:hypothetical protein